MKQKNIFVLFNFLLVILIVVFVFYSFLLIGNHKEFFIFEDGNELFLLFPGLLSLLIVFSAFFFIKTRKKLSVKNQELEKVKDSVAESEERFRMFMDKLPGLAYIKDSETKAIFVNKGFSTYLNMDPDSMLNKSASELFPPEFAKLIEADDRGVLESEQSKVIEEEFGGKFWLTNKFVIQSSDGKPMLGGITLDVTEKKKVEQEARKLSHAVEQSPLSIVITDTKGDIEYVNPRFSELTGYSFEEVKGKNPRILKSNLHPKEVYKNLWNMITAGKIWKGEFRNIKKNGEAYWEAASISPIFNEKGEITHYIALKENITEKKRIEE